MLLFLHHHQGESSSGRERTRARACCYQGEGDSEGDESSLGESKDEGEGKGMSSSLDDRNGYIIVTTRYVGEQVYKYTCTHRQVMSVYGHVPTHMQMLGWGMACGLSWYS